MEKIRLAFYKAQKGDWFGGLISRYTNLFNWGTPEYCHVEIGFLIHDQWWYYSSASKNTNGKTGTRWLLGSTMLEHRERWDVYEVEALKSHEDMMKICSDELNKPYDWLGIFGFATLFGQANSRNAWYCSEICNYIFFGEWTKRISPKRLYSKVRKTCGDMVLLLE